MSSHRRTPDEIRAAFARLKKEPQIPIDDVLPYAQSLYGGAFGLLSRNVLIRYAIEGRGGADGVRVWLDAAKRGRTWVTSHAAVTRFLRSLAERTRVLV